MCTLGFKGLGLRGTGNQFWAEAAEKLATSARQQLSWVLVEGNTLGGGVVGVGG